jgi:hypothetical protein
MAEIRRAILAVLLEQHPTTCRGLFYALVSRGVIPKLESQYKSTVVRLATEMRKAGDLPYEWLADNTRWMRKPATWTSLEHALEATARLYRRALWPEQDAYVEVWLEKDALSGVIYDVTERWDVPLMVTRGYASLSFLHSAAQTIARLGKPTHLYYLGDYDPSGLDIPRNVEDELRRLAPSADIVFTRLGVNAEQIESMELPTRPTKRSDTRAAGFFGESVEVDAIPAPILRNIVEEAILSHVDQDRLESLEEVERSERETLEAISQEVQYRTEVA